MQAAFQAGQISLLEEFIQLFCIGLVQVAFGGRYRLYLD
jgi:hypothetical protein